MKQPTMHDVAFLAGVSQPTVSRVLNMNDTSIAISEETRQRVLAAVEESGYRPNVIARNLRMQRTQMIALLIADISNGFYHPIVHAIQGIARQHDYEVLVSNRDHLYKNEKHFCEHVSRRAVDGVIMVSYHLTAEELTKFSEDINAPITVLGEHIDSPNIDVVYVNDERATYEGIRWMIAECGYTSFGFLGVEDDLPPGPRRFRGFQRALHDSSLELDSRFLLKGDFTRESGARVAQELLSREAMPRAVFALNDLMAIGLILALQEAGCRVPEDIAVMGFDNIPETLIVRPTLTTIAQDSRDIGEKLAAALFERIENPSIRGRRVFESSFQLITRQST